MKPIEGKALAAWKFWFSDMEFFDTQIGRQNFAWNAQQVIDNQKFIFKFEESKLIDAEQVSSYWIRNIFRKLRKEAKPTLRSQKEHDKYVESLLKKANTIWNTIYKKGVIQNNGNIEGKDSNYLILVDRGKGKKNGILKWLKYN